MPDRKTKKAVRNGAGKRGRSNPTTGSYLLSLELENVRCFSERQTLDLSDGNGRHSQWTILLGENGTGKTTILQLLVMFMPHLTTLQKKTSSILRDPNSTIDFPAMSHGYVDARTLLRGPDNPASSIAMRFLNDDQAKSFSIALEVSKYDKRTIEYQVGVSSATNEPLVFPLCLAYGSGRLASTSSLDQSEYTDAFETLFLDDAKLRNGEDWLLRLDYSASKESEVQAQQKQRLEMVKEVLINILPDVEGIRFDPSSGVMPTPSVQFETHYGWVPFRQLGYGYRSMIAWAVDFASRMVERYPDSSDPLAEPAVVLIDEIDLHLHPKWQRDVIGYLTERFPNTQFIATSHSPLIVQAAANANIALLKREGDHVVIKNHPEKLRGWRVDQVLTSELFGLETARPPDMEKLLRRRKEILTKPRLTRADQKKLEAINDQIGPIAPGESFDEARKTMDLIERSIELVKKYQGTKT